MRYKDPWFDHLRTDLMTSFCKSCLYVLTVITSKDLQKHGNVWVCPISDHVCTRFLFVWVREAAETFPPPGVIQNFQTIFEISATLGFSLSQVRERPGGRCPRRHSGIEDPQGNFTSNCFEAVLKNTDWEYVLVSLWLNSLHLAFIGLTSGHFSAFVRKTPQQNYDNKDKYNLCDQLR